MQDANYEFCLRYVIRYRSTLPPFSYSTCNNWFYRAWVRSQESREWSDGKQWITWEAILRRIDRVIDRLARKDSRDRYDSSRVRSFYGSLHPLQAIPSSCINVFFPIKLSISSLHTLIKCVVEITVKLKSMIYNSSRHSVCEKRRIITISWRNEHDSATIRRCKFHE